MSTITIDLTTPIKIKVADASGVETEYDLKAGLNDVPPEVASHWYVQKFVRPSKAGPRRAIPSPQLTAAALARQVHASAPAASTPAGEPVPAAKPASEPAE